MAATTLSGFLQCNFLSMDPPMQAHFEALCKTCLPKKRKRELGSIVDTIPSAGGETPPEYQVVGKSLRIQSESQTAVKCFAL